MSEQVEGVLFNLPQSNNVASITTDNNGDLILNAANSTSNVMISDPTNNNNLCLGSGCGIALNGAASNTCIGNGAASSLITGLNNVFVGSSSGANVTSASYNTFMGTGAGANTTTGQYNTFYGHQAANSLTTSNTTTAIGSESLYTITTGANNTACGYQAGQYLSASSSNCTCIGSSATTASTDTSEYNNLTLIGYEAAPLKTSSSNSIDTVGVNNQVVIGAPGTTTFFGGNFCVPTVESTGTYFPATPYLGMMSLWINTSGSTPIPYLSIYYGNGNWAAVQLNVP